MLATDQRAGVRVLEYVGDFLRDPVPVDRHVAETAVRGGGHAFEVFAPVLREDCNGVLRPESGTAEGGDQPVDPQVEVDPVRGSSFVDKRRRFAQAL